MELSGFFIFNLKGEVLISRLYRHDIKRSVADAFRVHVIASTAPTSTTATSQALGGLRTSPITTLGSTTFYHIRHENLFLVAVCKLNPNAAMIFEWLYRFCNLGRAYFGRLDEDAIKNNFVLVYELLDEICDFGYAQIMESDALKMHITTESVLSEKAVQESAKSITIQATGAIAWRRNDIKYRKNEVFVDVIESINCLMGGGSAVGDRDGILRADVAGQVIMRAYLSGMPECKFGINDRLMIESRNAPSRAPKAEGTVELDDVQFHQCVRLGKFDSDRTISFVPPDGEFELMRYRTTESINVPFKVFTNVSEPSRTRMEYRIQIRSQFHPQVFAQNVALKIPTPPTTSGCKVSCTLGKAKYVGAENAVIWKIPKFQGQTEHVVTVELEVVSNPTQTVRWARPPISMDFQVLMFTASGMLVRFLKIFERTTAGAQDYPVVKWVRYLTRAGHYEIRF